MIRIFQGCMRRMALRTRIALATSLLFVFFAAASGSFVIWKMQKELRHTIAVQQHALATSIAGSIDSKVERALTSLMGVSERLSPEIAADPVEANRFLLQRAALPILFDRGLYLFDRTGKLTAHTPFHFSPANIPSHIKTFIQQTVATREAAVSAPYQPLEDEGEPELMLAAPIKDRSGRVAFVLAGSLRLLGKNMLGDLDDIKIGTMGYVFLMTEDRTLLYHPNRNRIMEPVAGADCSPLFLQAARGFDGSGECANPGGIKTLSSFRHLKTQNWVLGINHPLSEAYAVIYTTRNNLVTGFAIGTISILILTSLVMKLLTRPLESFTRQVEEMDEHHLSTIEADTQNDEVGMLAQAFNGLVRELQTHQERLLEEEKKYRTVADNTYDWEFWLSPDDRFVYSSPSCRALTGYDAADFEEFPDMMERIVFPEDRQAFREHMHPEQPPYGRSSVEFRIITADGKLRWISHACHPVFGEDGAFLGIRGSNRDITAQKQVEQRLHEVMGQQQVIIDNIPDMAWLKDRDGRYVQVNRQFCAICGLEVDEIVGRKEEDVWAAELAQKYSDDDRDVMASKTRRTFETHVVDRTGKAYFMEMVKSPLLNDRGEAIGIIGIAHDITRRMQEELILRHASTHDTLTGLYNRTYFDEEMQRFARSRRYPISIIMGDVNDLKLVNDTHGHAVGDELLCLAAKAILDAFRAEDIVARIGGDEFAVLLPETDEATAAEAMRRIRSNLATLNEAGREYQVNVALGMATALEGDDLLQAFALSDRRMYQQKAALKAFAGSAVPLPPEPESAALPENKL